jgi:nucleotide-binding universal stress UspA family protein
MYFNASVSRSEGVREVPGIAPRRGAAVAGIGKQKALQKLLIPVDGSPASIHAVEYAIRHANEGVRVHLMNVQPPILSGEVHYAMSVNAVLEARCAAGENALTVAKALLDANHIEYTTEIVFGSPARAIVRCAVNQKCTKIVMATKGRSLLGNLISRSVSNRVVRFAHVPVTLIKERSTVRKRNLRYRRQGAVSAYAS